MAVGRWQRDRGARREEGRGGRRRSCVAASRPSTVMGGVLSISRSDVTCAGFAGSLSAVRVAEERGRLGAGRRRARASAKRYRATTRARRPRGERSAARGAAAARDRAARRSRERCRCGYPCIYMSCGARVGRVSPLSPGGGCRTLLDTRGPGFFHISHIHFARRFGSRRRTREWHPVPCYAPRARTLPLPVACARRDAVSRHTRERRAPHGDSGDSNRRGCPWISTGGISCCCTTSSTQSGSRR